MSLLDPLDAALTFCENVDITTCGDNVTYRCREGLWVVTGPKDEETEKEAWRSFRLRYDNGDYK